MDFNPILPKWRLESEASKRHWPNKLLTDYLDEAVAATPDKTAWSNFNSMTGKKTVLSFKELQALSDRIALGLLSLGVEKNDVVSIQLPNWWEVVAIYLATTRIGAVINPLMPIFREREISYMVGFAESKVMIVPRNFRKHDYPEMMAGLRSDLPKLEHVLVIGGDGENAFERVLLNPALDAKMDKAALFKARRPVPDDVSLLMYTSGTTGQPKGAMHTANTLMGSVKPYCEGLELTEKDVVLMASPLAHLTGFLYGLMVPIYLKSKGVLQDIWSAEECAKQIEAEGVTFSMGATPFLADLTNTPDVQNYDIKTFRKFVCAGAPIPAVLVQQATKKLGVRVISAWGMTEIGVATAVPPEADSEQSATTDGAPLDGFDVKITNLESGATLPVREPGQLMARGPGAFVGYLKKPDLYGTDSEGWFDTGDIAYMNEDGYIRISGRSKDIIIRGGENVPVAEVEQTLYRHPAIQEVAVVAIPDPRLGELGCAFVSLKEGCRLSFEDMVAFLGEQKMAKQYLPERLEILDAMPHTPSGKIQKFKLREMAKAFAKA
ncbi:MAG: cyclohexanecarboxylate-CoA ligase [Rhodospirillaceae bacterium]|nr:MAG: cyclohexanecarboxylate-CoA ligase [Rhodospirillaceae bacterium]